MSKVYEENSMRDVFTIITALLKGHTIDFIGNCVTPFHILRMETTLRTLEDISGESQGILLISDHFATGRSVTSHNLRTLLANYDIHVIYLKSHKEASTEDIAFLERLIDNLDTDHIPRLALEPDGKHKLYIPIMLNCRLAS